MSNPFRDLPAVTKVLAAPALEGARGRHSPDAITAQVRAALDAVRARLAAGEALAVSAEALAEEVLAALDAQAAPALRPVINATGDRASHQPRPLAASRERRTRGV